MKFLAVYKEQIYAILRIVAGLLFIQHGLQKVNAMLSGVMPANNILMILAAIIETFAGFMIIIGWQTRTAAFIASGEMAVAYFKVHVFAAFLPINNKGELAVIYCFVFLFIAAYGPGMWSVDRFTQKRSGRTGVH